MNLASPADPVTITNLPYDATGNILPARVRPSGSGFGQATAGRTRVTCSSTIKFSF